MERPNSRVYISIDSSGNIIQVEGEYTLPQDLTGWVLIEEGAPCDRLNLAQSHYFPDGLYNEYGIPLYKYTNGNIQKRTDEEVTADVSAQLNATPPPTKLDIIEAQITYTAMMTDTLLN